MKRYVKANLSDWYKEGIVEEVIAALDAGRNVYIEDGGINDKIIGYEHVENHKGAGGLGGLSHKNVIFMVTGATEYFGTKVNLYDFEKVDTEYFKGDLFVEVSY